MKFEEIEYESVIMSHIRIFMYLASKYVTSILGYEHGDLVHEQIIECYKQIKKCTDRNRISSFLYIVSENKLKTIYRDQMRQKRMPKQLLYMENLMLGESSMCLSEGMAQNDEQFYVSQIYCNVEKVASQDLSKFEYYVYRKHIVEKMDCEQIALDSGKSQKQIQNAVTRIRKKLCQKRDFILSEM